MEHIISLYTYVVQQDIITRNIIADLERKNKGDTSQDEYKNNVERLKVLNGEQRAYENIIKYAKDIFKGIS